MSEISMVSSRKSRLELDAKKGNRGAKKALELANNPGKFLSTVQIGITLIGIFTGIYSGEKIEDDLENYFKGFGILQPYSDTLSVTVIVILLTFFSLVLGELVPKRIGLTMPETIGKLLSYPMYFISVIAAPFIWLLTITTDGILKIFGIKKTKESYVTEEEIKAIIQEGTEAGNIREIEQDIVENVFHLGDRKISSLMTQRHDISWLNSNESHEINKSKIIKFSHKSFPVCKVDLDKIIGVVYAKDILDSMLKGEPFNIEKHITPPLFMPERTTAYKALETFKESKQHVAIVVDEFGGVQGILTINDLMDVLVGDLSQQLHDKKEIIPRDDGSFLVDASLPLPEFARYFDIDIAGDEDVAQINTVGGLAFYFGKKIPYTGFKFKWKNILFEIIDMDDRRIDKILVKKEN